MQNGANFFVRVNYSIDGKNTRSNCTGAHITTMGTEGEGKYLIGGGFFNKNRGSFLFKAKDLKEANEMAKNNSFVKNKTYSYELIILDSKIKIA